MRPIARTISKNRAGFGLCSLLLFAGMLCTFYWTKLDSFFLLNAYHRPWLDSIMIPLTHVGDGIFSLCIAIVFFFLKRKVTAAQIAISFLFSGLLAQAGKYLWAAPRPRVIISKETYQYFIEGVTGTGMSSFPSGHTTSIFALVTVLILTFPNRLVTASLVLCAFLIGYSRIYLGQHFLEDVLAGAFLGMCASVLVVFATERIKLFKRTGGEGVKEEKVLEEAMP